MKLITLEIKAADFKPDGYTDSVDCPITKALQRAGLEGYADHGMDISDSSGKIVTNTGKEDYRLLVVKVVGMFSTLDGESYWVSGEPVSVIPVEDFTHVLELDL
jgi:hypothetical protein